MLIGSFLIKSERVLT